MKGKVWKFGNDIDTDIILPGRYLIYTDEERLSEHCMEGLDEDFNEKFNKGDFIVAGNNFGCGSSREHAPIALKGLGVSAVIAESFARIFYRNSTNVGVPLLEAPGITDLVEEGEEIEVDMEKGTITSQNGKSITFKKLPPFMLEILEKGGLIEYLKQKNNKYQIAIVPGDGIGQEVMEATLSVLEGLDLDFDYVFGEAGDECLEKNGVALPEETLDIIRNSDACLFGAAGESASSVIVKIRQEMKMFANLRPVKSYPNTKSLSDNIDFMIVRENTEGMYIADEEEYTPEGAIARRIITREAEERIIRYAFEYAKENNKSKVTAVHKANVLKKTDGLFKEIFYEVAKEYPEIETEDFYVDATAMYFITNPQNFEVIVTTNLFGDILSDEGAGIVGGLGLLPSANIGLDAALFEPVHGSAPDIAGEKKANPTAMLLSAAMMLRYLNENEAADKLDKAILKILSEGKTLTGDLGGSANTFEMAEAIKKELIGDI